MFITQYTRALRPPRGRAGAATGRFAKAERGRDASGRYNRPAPAALLRPSRRSMCHLRTCRDVWIEVGKRLPSRHDRLNGAAAPDQQRACR
jgi:hypothetical protein